MNHEKRLDKLEQAVKNFNLTLAGTDQILGGFPELKPHSSIEARLEQLEKAHEAFFMSGGPNAKVEGSLKTGYSINMICPEVNEETSP